MLEIAEINKEKLNEKILSCASAENAERYKFVLSTTGRPGFLYSTPPMNDECTIDLVSKNKKGEIMGYISLFKDLLLKRVSVCIAVGFGKNPIENIVFIKDLKEVYKRYFLENPDVNIFSFGACEDNPVMESYLKFMDRCEQNGCKINVTRSINSVITYDNKLHNQISFQIIKDCPNEELLNSNLEEFFYYQQLRKERSIK